MGLPTSSGVDYPTPLCQGVHWDNGRMVIMGDCNINKNEISALPLPEWNKDNYYNLKSDCNFLKRDWRNVPYWMEFLSEVERIRSMTARMLVQAALESQ